MNTLVQQQKAMSTHTHSASAESSANFSDCDRNCVTIFGSLYASNNKSNNNSNLTNV